MAESTALIKISPEAQELIAFAGTFLSTASAIQITTQDQAQAVVEQVKAIKECAAAIDETRKGYTRPLDEEKSAYIEMFRPAVDVLTRAEKLGKDALFAWDAEQRRVAAEQEKARRIQEDDDRKRQLEEQAAAAQLLQQADDALASGDIARAQELEEQAAAAQLQAAPIPCPVTTPAPTKTRGFSGRTIWKCKVINPALVPAAYLMPNQVLLDALAATAKGVGAAPAGCEWTSSSSGAIR